jgi:RND family efflux transporter MFP subunit
MSPRERFASLTRRSLLLSLGALALLACGGNEYVAPPPPKVTVARPEVRDVTRYAEYTGTTRAVERVVVRARVEGFLLSMEYEPGDFVEKGAPLFVIDPEPFELTLKSAEAELTSAKAEHELAKTEFKRTAALYKQQATSEINFIKLKARRDTAAAAVLDAEAKARSAQLDLDYAHVEAPVAGRVGRHLVDLGNLVGADGPTQLTDVVTYSPLYVYFHVSERDLLDFQTGGRERRQEAGADWDNRPPTPLYVGRANEVGFPHEGIIDYTALELDASTGTFEVRAILPNEGELDEVIIPGTFVRVRLPVAQVNGALLVPERALGADQSGRYVLVVNDDNIVEQRRVQVGPPRLDGTRIVEKGVQAEDWVVTNGIQRARPGAPVEPERQEAKAAQGGPDASDAG